MIVGCVLLSLIPIWSFRYFPSQDGPSHLENAYLLFHYFDPARPISQYYDLNLQPVPNWFSHVALGLLMVLFSPLFAEKVFLTGYVLFFVFAFRYFLRAVDEDKEFLVLLAVPFIFHYPLLMGFYNFSFSIPLMFFILGYWFKHRARSGELRFLVNLNVLLIFLYFCHIVSQLLTILSILILAFLCLRPLKRAWAQALTMIPSYFLPVYFINHQVVSVPAKWTMGDGAYFFKLGSLVAYSAERYSVGGIIVLLTGILILVTLVSEKIKRHQNKIHWQPSVKDGFLLLAVIFTGLYFVCPPSVGRDHQFLHERLNLYPFLVLLPWLNVRLNKALKAILAGLMTVVVCVQIILLTTAFRSIQPQIEEYVSGVPFVKRNTTLLPVGFQHFPDQAKVASFLHVSSYYNLLGGCLSLDNYEAHVGYFPLKFKPGLNPFVSIGDIENGYGDIQPWMYPQPIDYVLLWSPREHFLAKRWIEEHYTLIHRQDRLWLYELTEGF